MATTTTTTTTPGQGHGRLLNKVAIVTGGASGIGRAISLRFASEGAHVVIADKVPSSRSSTETEPTHTAILALGQKSLFVETDVTSAASVDALVLKTVQEFGRVDIMCNNAGAAFEIGSTKKGVWEMEDSVWQKSLDLNATGVFYGVRAASKQMMSQDPHHGGDRGWIINTSSIVGQVAVPGACAYVAAKHLVMGLTKSAALDLAPHRIHVNAICPGFVVGPFAEYDEPTTKRLEMMHPFGARMGEPGDIAGVAVFLASADAKWVTGHGMVVDGGYICQ